MTDESITLEDLNNEKDLIKKINHFRNQVSNLESILKPFCDNEIYADLTNEERVKFDIFLSYSLTSVYWMYVRTCGIDPFGHAVKSEVDRVQEYMMEYKKIKDRKKMPHIDVGAAKRFIKHGLYDPNNPLALGKRKTFDDSGDEDE